MYKQIYNQDSLNFVHILNADPTLTRASGCSFLLVFLQNDAEVVSAPSLSYNAI